MMLGSGRSRSDLLPRVLGEDGGGGRARKRRMSFLRGASSSCVRRPRVTPVLEILALILEHRDAFDLDHQTRHRQRGNADAGPRRILAGVVAILDRNEKL